MGLLYTFPNEALHESHMLLKPPRGGRGWRVAVTGEIDGIDRKRISKSTAEWFHEIRATSPAVQQ